MYSKKEPELLVQYIRDGLSEQEHYGYIVLADKRKAIDFTGDSKNQPFYLRSCAKPLQASLIIDFELDKIYNMTEEEIALCCASHAGEEIHTKIAKKLMKKFGINKKELHCGLHKPISKTEQEKLILSGKKENILQNNCSGKHIMMLGICKLKGWSIEAYENPEHPLQIAIKNKINELCKVTKDYPVTKDGCGVPIISMPLENMLYGYLNIFCNEKYEKINNAFLNHPYIIGGENRTDTKIIENSKDLVAKVGAGGLCIVVNTKTEEAFVVKISDADMKARELVVLQTLRNLHWADIESDTTIKTLHGEVIGEVKVFA